MRVVMGKPTEPWHCCPLCCTVYDGAIRLLREALEGSDLISFSLTDRIEAFLAAEPKEGEGGR